MALYDAHRTSPAPFRAGVLLTWPLRATLGKLRAFRDARETQRTLGRLSTHELDDLGLVRGDIDDLARRGRAG